MGHGPRRAGMRLAVVLLAALLGACESAGGGSPETEPGETSGSESADGDRASAEVAALPEPEIDDDPQRLLGLGPDALSNLLGRPELIRRESPAQVWQYRGAGCVFDVVLYQEAEDSTVTYVEARDGNGERMEPRPCLNQLLRARLAAESS